MSKAEVKRLLLCVNDDDYSRNAMVFACEIAKAKKHEIALLHVLQPADYQGFGAVADKIRAEQKENAKALLKELSAEVEKRIKKRPKILMREGAIEEEIIDTIEQQKNISMLITGCAADSNFKSKTIPALVGQLGQKLLVPTLIVPGVQKK